MMEKDADSMTTVQMKPEYAASEVYSTASEPPPAYRRQSSSVQIAKIIAVTVVISSFIIGSFILASSYLQARASCDQMSALDSVLEKELMLEALQQELPKAEALLSPRDNSVDTMNTNDIQDVTKDVTKDVKEKVDKAASTKPNESTSNSESDSTSESDSEYDSQYSNSDESEELNRVHIKLPLELNLNDLANAILDNNQKSRMNCVVERRRTEELIDAPGRNVQLPFGVNLTTDPKKQRSNIERMAIICESGTEQESPRNRDAEEIRPVIIPIQRFPIPYGAMPEQVPLTHMPQIMMRPQPPNQPQSQFIPPFLMRHIQQQQGPMPQMPPPQSMMRDMPPQSMMREMPPQPMMREMPPQQMMREMPPQQMMRDMSPQQMMREMPPQQMMREMPPQQMMREMPPLPPQQQQQQRFPDPMMYGPRSEQAMPQPSVRIQLHRIPIRGDMEEPVQVKVNEIPLPPQLMQHVQEQLQQQQSENGESKVQVQRVPLAVALQRAGITQNDLMNIQRIAEERIQQELRQLAVASDDDSESSEDSNEDEQQSEQQTVRQDKPETTQMHQVSEPMINGGQNLPMLEVGRSAYGRSLVTPIRIPVNMMQQTENESGSETIKPLFIQPRSIRSVDSVLKPQGEKRMKRCACDCAC